MFVMTEQKAQVGAWILSGSLMTLFPGDYTAKNLPGLAMLERRSRMATLTRFREA